MLKLQILLCSVVKFLETFPGKYELIEIDFKVRHLIREKATVVIASIALELKFEIITKYAMD